MGWRRQPAEARGFAKVTLSWVLSLILGRHIYLVRQTIAIIKPPSLPYKYRLSLI
jgi:hypothetical protein